MRVAPIIYENATAEQQAILTSQFDVEPFEIMTMTMERIFVDKLFAAEAYTRNADKEHRAFEASKHIYDLAVILSEERITALFENEDLLAKLLSIRLTEEQKRLDGIPGILPKDFIFFDEACSNPYIKKAYATMQNQYVLVAKERIELEEAATKMLQLKNKLEGCVAWLEAILPQSE